ncbi:MAG: cupin domain-containing protein [Spirochaetales bacterium]|nr:cupin domain-containing protein [Spirochaetales bacterium]
MIKLALAELPVYRAAAPNVRDNLVLVDGQTGAKNLSVGIGVYSRGQASEFHTHKNEEEVMIYLKGEGIMKREDGTESALKRGDITFVPADEPHKLINTGSGEFVFLFIYAPQGPEVHIRKWDIVKDLHLTLDDFV